MTRYVLMLSALAADGKSGTFALNDGKAATV
jgi:hypothetical protein